MTENKAFPKLKKHLSIFITISTLIFVGMFFASLLFLIFDEPTAFLRTQLPGFVRYFGLFISLMMIIMGLTYLKFLKKNK